jgi:quinol monooxygenase YgiN
VAGQKPVSTNKLKAKMASPLYVVVRFELKPGELDVLVPLIQAFFEKEVRTVPGFISARLHANEAGTVLLNYATWESAAHFHYFIEQVARVSEISKKIQAFGQHTDKVFEIPL